MPTRLVDLSHVVEDGVITYPGLPGPVISQHMTFEDSHDHYAPNVEFQIGRIDMVANTGTYVDTPAHRYRGAWDLAGLPLESVADLRGVVIDANAQTVNERYFEGRDLAGRAVIVRTGWSKHWGTDSYGDSGHPYLTAAAAELLVKERVALVGIDSVNIDDTAETGRGERPMHSKLLAAGIPVLEHLCGLEQLDGPFRLFAVPPKVKGMATFPVRAFAIVEVD